MALISHQDLEQKLGPNGLLIVKRLSRLRNDTGFVYMTHENLGQSGQPISRSAVLRVMKKLKQAKMILLPFRGAIALRWKPVPKGVEVPSQTLIQWARLKDHLEGRAVGGGAPKGNSNRNKNYKGARFVWMFKRDVESFIDIEDVHEMKVRGWAQGRVSRKQAA